MAATFRDFLYGIGQAAPRISEMIYNHVQTQNERELRERRLAVEERQVTALEKKTTAEAGKLEAQATEITSLLEVKIRLENIKTDLASGQKRMAEAMEQGRRTEGGGSLEGFFAKTISNEFALSSKELDKLDATIANIDANTLNTHDLEIYRDTLAQLEVSKFQSNMFFTLSSLADEAPLSEVAKIWSSNIGDDNVLNMKGFVNEISASGLKRTNPFLANSVNQMVGTWYESTIRNINGMASLMAQGVIDKDRKITNILKGEMKSAGVTDLSSSGMMTYLNASTQLQMKEAFTAALGQVSGSSPFTNSTFSGYNTTDERSPDFVGLRQIQTTPRGDGGFGSGLSGLGQRGAVGLQEAGKVLFSQPTQGKIGEISRGLIFGAQ